jgi:hypothetical protein
MLIPIYKILTGNDQNSRKCCAKYYPAKSVKEITKPEYFYVEKDEMMDKYKDKSITQKPCESIEFYTRRAILFISFSWSNNFQNVRSDKCN